MLNMFFIIFPGRVDQRLTLDPLWGRIWTQLRLFRALQPHWCLSCLRCGWKPAPVTLRGTTLRALTCSALMPCQ